MAYQSNKPAANDKLKDSQADIQTNFSDIKTAFDVNHEALTGTGGDEGKHKFVQLTLQNADVTTAATDAAVFHRRYTKANNANTLFIRKQNNGDFIPLTSGTQPSANFAANTQGYSFLGSGLLLKRGNVNVNSVGPNSKVMKTINIGSGAFINQPQFTFIGGIWLQPAFNGEPPVGRLDFFIDYTNTTVNQIVYYVENAAGATSTGNFRVSYLIIGACDLSTT